MKTIEPPSNRKINIHLYVKKISSQMPFPPRGHLVIMIYWPESVFPTCQTIIIIPNRSYLLFDATNSLGGFSPNACLFDYTYASVSCQWTSSSTWHCNIYVFFLCVCVVFCELVYYQLLCYLCTYNKYTVNAMNNLQFVTFQEVI